MDRLLNKINLVEEKINDLPNDKKQWFKKHINDIKNDKKNTSDDTYYLEGTHIFLDIMLDRIKVETGDGGATRMNIKWQ